MATPKKWVKVTLFLSSYFPLWIIFLVILVVDHQSDLFMIKDIKDAFNEYAIRNWPTLLLAGSLIFVAFFPLVVLRRLIKEIISGTNPDRIMIQGREELTSEYMLYIITYVFPFLTANVFQSSTAISLIGIMVTIAILYIRANLFHVNPTLMLFNYRLFKVMDENNTYYLLSKRDSVFKNQTIKAYSMSGVIYIEKPYEPSGTTVVEQ